MKDLSLPTMTPLIRPPFTITPSFEESLITRLFSSAESHRIAEMLAILQSHPGLAWTENPFGETVLGDAIARTDNDIVKVLLNHTPDIAIARDDEHNTPLMKAVRHGTPEIVALLLPHSDHQAKNLDGLTALMVAACEGQSECLSLLLPVSHPEATDKKGWTALHAAAVHGHEACVKVLLPSRTARKKDKNGYTPLMLAVRTGHVSCLRLLWKHNDMKATEEKGREVLQIAVDRSQPASVAALILLGYLDSHPALVNTVFKSACVQQEWACAELLSPFCEDNVVREVLDQHPNARLPVTVSLLEKGLLHGIVANTMLDGTRNPRKRL